MGGKGRKERNGVRKEKEGKTGKRGREERERGEEKGEKGGEEKEKRKRWGEKKEKERHSRFHRLSVLCSPPAALQPRTARIPQPLRAPPARSLAFPGCFSPSSLPSPPAFPPCTFKKHIARRWDGVC